MQRPRKSKEEIATAAIKRGKSNEEALDAVRKVYPGSQMSAATINYWRNHLRRTNPKIKSASALRGKR